MKLDDFWCPVCNFQGELLLSAGEAAICPECQNELKKLPARPRVLTEIIPDYPGCKKQKAGYVHSHGNQDATKIQSGYGGSQGPKH